MKPKLPLVMIIVLFILSSSCATVRSAAYATMEIYGTVTDVNGNPISQAVIIALDWKTLTYSVTRTDSHGNYRLTVTRTDELGHHTYIVYAYHINPKTGIFDYVPSVYPHDIYGGAKIADTREVSFKLYPAATLVLRGDEGLVWYVLSRETPIWFIFKVVDHTTGESPSINVSCIYVYGHPPYGSREGPDVRFISEFINWSTVVIPAGIPVHLVAKAEFRSDWTGRLEVISFIIDNDGEPFNLSQGESMTVDVRSFSYKYSVEALGSVIGEVEESFVRAEQAGFYVGALREDLRGVSRMLDEAKSQLPPVNPSPSEKEYDRVRYSLLERAYDQIRIIMKNLSLMYVIAQSHAAFFPFFFAFFTLILAFFLFEKDRKKVIFSLMLYPLTIISLFYIYPGFSIITRTDVTLKVWFIYRYVKLATVSGLIFFVGIAAAAIAAAIIAFFILPRVYREPTAETRPPLRRVIPTLFSLGKRNVKRRKLRSLFCILSLTILVWGFTALTSFSRVYDVVAGNVNPTITGISGVLLQKIKPKEDHVSSPSEFFTLEELSSLAGRPKVEKLIPKVENLPSSAPLLRLKSSSGEKIDVYGILGICPSLEEKVMNIKDHIVSGQLTDEDEFGIAISREMADALNLKVNDKVEVYEVSAGVERPIGNFTLAAILDRSFFNLRDANNNPLAPYKMTKSGLKSTNEMETVVFTWRTALKISKKTGISRVIVTLKDSSEKAIREFARSMAHKEYVAWAISNGHVQKYYIGMIFEMRGFTHLTIPFILVILNVASVMITLIHEREEEIRLLSTLGLNPSHIAFLFLAESAVMGLIGGGIGYYIGLGTYRIMTLLGPSGQIGVRQKLEWYWGVLGMGVAVLASLLSAVMPAKRAAEMASPSIIKRMKMPEEEREKREREIFKVYARREYSMPIKVHEKEIPYFTSYMLDRFRGISGVYQRFEGISTEDVIMSDGTRVFRIKFTYTFVEAENEYSTKNELVVKKKPNEEYYIITLSSEPSVPGLPERIIETTVSIVKDMLMEWTRRRDEVMTGGG